MTATQQDIRDFREKYEKRLDKTHKNLIKLTWYMRGGVSLSEIYDMPVTHIKYIEEVVQENIELSKKAKTPIL